MAALPPQLLAVLVLLLTTATTAQCLRHKHHQHTAKMPKAAAAVAPPPATVRGVCYTTPHPVACLSSAAAHLDSAAAQLVVSSITIPLLPPSVLSMAPSSLSDALAAVSSVSPEHSSTLSAPQRLRRGAAQDCLELHDATLASLSRSASLLASAGEGLPAVRAHLTVSLMNKATCLDGLAGASGPLMDGLLATLDVAYAHVSNSLSLVAGPGACLGGGTPVPELALGGGGAPALELPLGEGGAHGGGAPCA